MGKLSGTDLTNQRKNPVVTSVFETGMPQNGFSAVTIRESYTSARNRDLVFQPAG